MPRVSSSARRSYVSRRKHSHCSGITATQCRHRKGCRMTKGKKRMFCRKTNNRSRTKHKRRTKHRRH